MSYDGAAHWRQMRAKNERETTATLAIVTSRFKETSLELAILGAAKSELRRDLARVRLELLGVKGHVVEFKSEYQGPETRRMVVEDARYEYDDAESKTLLLVGKVFTTRGKLSKDEWTVAAEGAKDCGKYETAPIDGFREHT